MSGMAHRMGKIDFDNLNAEKGYNPSAAYAQSKLANLFCFHLRLNRQFEAHGLDLMAVSSGLDGDEFAARTHGNSNPHCRTIGADGALPTLRSD